MDWFYGGKNRPIPIIPQHLDNIAYLIRRTAPDDPAIDNREELQAAANELSENGSHVLVIMGWRDFMVPLAEAGGMDEMNTSYKDELLVMLRGREPEAVYRPL